MPPFDNIAAYNLRPLTLTWLADKWKGFNTDDYRTPADKDFVESYMKSGEDVVSPLDGEIKRFDYFHTMDYVRRPKNYGCWGGLDRRPNGKNNPACSSCRVRDECRPESETLWVRESSSRGENRYRFSQNYIESIQKLNSGRRIPLVELGHVLFKDKLSPDVKVAKRMIDTFKFTDQELDGLFTNIPELSDTYVQTQEDIPTYETPDMKLQDESMQMEQQRGHYMEYPQEFNKKLVHSDVEYKILTSIPKKYREYLPSPGEPVTVLDEENGNYPTKMHSRQPRIDGLTEWYKNHPNIAIGDKITVVIEAMDRIRMMPSNAERQGTSHDVNPQQEEYKELPIEPDPVSDIDIVTLLIGYFSATGLHFSPRQLATFYTALQTKGFVILSGISGTGKTKLAQHFANTLPSPTNPIEQEPSDTEIDQDDRPEDDVSNLLFVPVRPDWRDSKSLLGYFNPLMGTYEWTPFLRFLLNATQSYEEKDDYCWFVILDEMNLARVEYYFADLLSVLESGWDEDGWTREPLRLNYPDDAEGDLPPHTMKIPPNLYIVGTVNVDETTHSFSPKVLDRAFSIELTETDFSGYPVRPRSDDPLSDDAQTRLLDQFIRGGDFAVIDKEVVHSFVAQHGWVRDQLQSLNSLLRPHDFHFGYRVFDEIIAFLANAEQNRTFDDLGGLEAAFDAAVLMKVLPKFHGSRGRLEQPLQAMLAWCLDSESPDRTMIEEALTEARADTIRELLDGLEFRYQETAKRASRMLWSLYTNGFASFG